MCIQCLGADFGWREAEPSWTFARTMLNTKWLPLTTLPDHGVASVNKAGWSWVHVWQTLAREAENNTPEKQKNKLKSVNANYNGFSCESHSPRPVCFIAPDSVYFSHIWWLFLCAHPPKHTNSFPTTLWQSDSMCHIDIAILVGCFIQSAWQYGVRHVACCSLHSSSAIVLGILCNSNENPFTEFIFATCCTFFCVSVCVYVASSMCLVLSIFRALHTFLPFLLCLCFFFD